MRLASGLLTAGERDEIEVGVVGCKVGQAIAVHEGAHALTCRHHGARVNGAGFLFYMGMPAFFADTTDIWTKPLRARLSTSWAGP